MLTATQYVKSNENEIMPGYCKTVANYYKKLKLCFGTADPNFALRLWAPSVAFKSQLSKQKYDELLGDRRFD